MSEMSHPYYVSSSDFVNDLLNNSKTNDRKINNYISQYCSMKMNLGLHVLITRDRANVGTMRGPILLRGHIHQN